MDPFVSDKTAVDSRLELPPLPKPKSEPQLKAVQHNYTPWGDFTNSPFPQEDKLGKAYGKIVSRALFGEDSDNTNLMTGLVPGADIAIKLSEGKQPGILDGLGDLKPLAAMLPVLKWGKELPAPKTRTGKSQRNLDKHISEKMMPTVVRFHRTTNDAADKILDEGLRIRNENSGRFTADAGYMPPMIWLANNPNRIPVLNTRFNAPDGPRMNPNVSTLKVEIPQEEYDQMKRFTQVPSRHGRRFVEVDPGEQSLFDDYATGRMQGLTKTDLIGEDIRPDYISLLPKPEPGRLVDEATNRQWERLLLGNERVGKMKDAELLRERLPRELRNKVANLELTNDDAEELYKLLPSVREFKYRSNFPGTRIPSELAYNTPARPLELKSFSFKPGSIARGLDSRGLDPFGPYLELRDVDQIADDRKNDLRALLGGVTPQEDVVRRMVHVNTFRNILSDETFDMPRLSTSIGSIGRGFSPSSDKSDVLNKKILEREIRNAFGRGDTDAIKELIGIDGFNPMYDPDEYDSGMEFLQELLTDLRDGTGVGDGRLDLILDNIKAQRGDVEFIREGDRYILGYPSRLPQAVSVDQYDPHVTWKGL